MPILSIIVFGVTITAFITIFLVLNYVDKND